LSARSYRARAPVTGALCIAGSVVLKLPAAETLVGDVGPLAGERGGGVARSADLCFSVLFGLLR
jgi:hypothetical protein